jgi:hypothetical protein
VHSLSCSLGFGDLVQDARCAIQKDWEKCVTNSEQQTGDGAASQSIVRLQKSELKAPFGDLVCKKGPTIMTNKDQNVDAVKESEESIGFLRASKKAWKSTFEVPSTMLKDLGFSKESEGSIGFLRASEKMWISTFDIPLTFLKDMGFSKERTQVGKDFNQKFISGFYGRVRSSGEKISGGGRSQSGSAGQKSPSKKAKPARAAKASKKEASTKAKPAKVAAKAKTKTAGQKDAASNAAS